ncbi:putative heavy metal-associated domain, HMA [Rosa chinensis]|uniref:Putative heavy metal-associated domain, HMA n=1 Tax=Rosa chinensis TaxID=74649 RepID=A0A2P6SFA3_ROSCH|nr:protein PYRICULARIA ORYZAE RESISTANCE 21 [Rosa chinensis]PRQ57347.1 putative heavy metal-associated domain, HMA [Rosa chinensis]
MGEKKVTIMILKVDLQCEKCYRKVKKVLCKFPEIRDQTYDEKNNQVIIKVVCCSPEKIRDKLCCKGGGAIKSIEIKEPEKPKEKPKEDKPPKEGEKPKVESESKPKPKNPCCMECYGGRPGGPCETGYGYGGPAPYIQYDGYYGRPVYDSYGGGRSYTTSYCVTRPDCFSEENPQACAIM